MTVFLLRHGVSTSNIAHTLAGRTPGVELTDHGRRQAAALADRLAAVPLAAIVRSPLTRCEQTVAALAAAQGLTTLVDDALCEVDYGAWTGRAIADLVKLPLWTVVRAHASAAVFPGGEGLAQVQARAVAAVRAHDARLAQAHGRDVPWIACTHGDVIKSVLADALGLHLDGFQRIVVEPASLSVIRYTPTAPYVWRINDTGGDYSAFVPADATADAAATADTDVPGGTAPQVRHTGVPARQEG